jgi:hypothetical protein
MCFAYRHPWSAAMYRAPELVAVGSRAERGVLSLEPLLRSMFIRKAF